MFTISENAVNPAAVPFKRFENGYSIPSIGFGTFGSDHVSADEMADAVRSAISLGYRHIDCAQVYGNEKEIGEVFGEVYASGLLKREDFFITSKLWNDKHQPENVRKECLQSIADLKADYLDLYLVHWPFPNYHAPHCDVTSRCPDARPYIHEEFMALWREFEKLVDDGIVRSIGVSNVTIPKLELILRDARIKPAAVEMELHPNFQQKELFDYVVAHGMVPIGYCPIGSPDRPERDKTPEDTVDIQDPAVVKVAEAHGVHPAVICVKWAAQRGQVPIPFSSKPRNMLSNIASLLSEPLTDEEMALIATAEKNCRLIKGQVFLWRDGQSWEALWDENGVIEQ